MAVKETKTLVELLAEVQAELKAPKGLRNTFGNYNYRSTESILEALKPILKEKGLLLTITDDLMVLGNRYYVRAIASIKKGDDEITVSAYAREEENKKGMDSAQVTGATSSYARKYALNGLFLIDDTKDPDSDEYQKVQNKGYDSSTPKQLVKPDDKPWLNEKDEKYAKAVEALKSKTVTLAQIISKYKLSKEVKAKLEAIK